MRGLNFLFQLKSYLVFLLRSGNEHGLHCPFIFDIYCTAIRPQKTFYCFQGIEELRHSLQQQTRVINVTDLGTGGGSNERSIESIANRTLKPPHIAQMLFRVVQYLQPLHILDLGTSLGITTAYLASGNPKAKVYSFEGCQNIAQEARRNFKKLSIRNVEIIEGNIDYTLQERLERLPSLDFAFIDANHTFEATLRYFEICLSKAHRQTVIVFDDIYWSEGMARAWETIKADKRVILSVDLFYLGITFLRPLQPKQHFILRI